MIMMGMALRLSGLMMIASPATSLYLSPSPNFISPLSLHFFSHSTPILTTFTSHAKLSGSAGEAPEEIDESFYGDEDLIQSDDEDETESSADLLIKFLQSMFRKASRHAKKASRSVLPAAISPQLVSFAVDGVLILASLSIIKALLEVVCTLGGTVFVVILLLRVIWATVSYFQTSGDGFSQGGSSFGTTQPIT